MSGLTEEGRIIAALAGLVQNDDETDEEFKARVEKFFDRVKEKDNG